MKMKTCKSQMINSLGCYFTLENLFKGPQILSQLFKVCNGMAVVLLKPKNLKKTQKTLKPYFFYKKTGFSTPGEYRYTLRYDC